MIYAGSSEKNAAFANVYTEVTTNPRMTINYLYNTDTYGKNCGLTCKALDSVSSTPKPLTIKKTIAGRYGLFGVINAEE